MTARPLAVTTDEKWRRAVVLSAWAYKRQILLYRHDERVAPWAGTAYGVLQAVNTYEHHDSAIRGTERSERNMLRAVTGQFGQLDRTSWRTLDAVLAA